MRRRGVALAAVLVALTVIGALLAGSFLESTQELRSGSARLHAARAAAAATWGVEQTVASWDQRWNGMYARGFGFEQTMSTAEGVALHVSVMRLSDDLFLIGADARDGIARRAAGRVVRLSAPVLRPSAALTASSSLSIVAAVVDGPDRIAAEGDCPEAGAPLPSVELSSDTARLRNLAGVEWNVLTSWATVRLGDGARIDPAPHSFGLSCHIDEAENWGEPRKQNGGACTSHYPIVYAEGSLTLGGGRGQGLLLVDGDLDVRGPFEFAGAIFVRGSARFHGTSTHVLGVMQIADASGGTSDLRGAVIEWSRCAVSRALMSRATPSRLRERAWFTVHGLR